MSAATSSEKEALPAANRGRSARRRRSLEIVYAGRFKVLFYAIAFLLIYGSLYPFNFTAPGGAFAGAGTTTDFWRLTTSRGDLLGNLVLFMPFGSIGMLAVMPSRSRGLRLAVLLILGFAVATGVQVLQIFLPTRTASAADVIWNLCGCLFGALLLWPPRFHDTALKLAGVSFAVLPACLLASWLAQELIPFVPSIDFQSFKDSVKPLIAVPDVLSVTFLGAVVSATVAAYLAERTWPGRVRLAWLLCGAVGLILAKIIIVQNSVTATFAAGLFCAALLSPLVLGQRRRVAPLLVAALAVYVAAAALEPFSLRAVSEPFSWVPFSGSLNGSMMVNAKAICAKIFLWGALLYCLKLAGVRLPPAIVVTGMLALLLEVAQIWIGTHTPEITDPLLVVLLGTVMLQIDEPGIEAVPRSVAETAAPPQDMRQGRSVAAGDREPLQPIAGRRLAVALAACVAAALGMNIVLGLPQIPYNLRELFGGDNAWWRLFVFSLAGLSIGLGGTLAGWLLAARQQVFLALPGYVLVASLVTYLLFLASVTEESLADITGSANTYWFVMNRDQFGAPGLWLYQAIGTRWPIDMVEHFVRFVALFGQPLLWIAILNAAYFRLVDPGRGGAPRYREALAKLVSCLLSAAPWLVILNLIAFRFSSTDNLNELISGHGHVLYFLFVLLPLVSLVVAHAIRQPAPRTALTALLVVIVSLPAGWLLFKNGLSPSVEKYSQVFSGVDFLLGPDRVEHLPEGVLMMRWFFVQCVVMAGLALGMQAIAVLPGRAGRRQ